ncbi:uncharacterized protein LOC119111324 [Pollicipes pollicipes]|uniref:uncharacterized protein LOC119111324 n=1 Tax=Pollicipes pollicipes TaxID=41117 RepID=UPI001884A16D|nr:uncharacterized protein LOC119111324 [Pollicipes pollicipes]
MLTVFRDNAAQRKAAHQTPRLQPVKSTDDSDDIDTVLQVSDPAQLTKLRLKVRCGDGDSVVKDHFVLSRSEYETSWWLGNFTVVNQLVPQVERNTLGVGAFWCQRYVEGVVDPVTSNRLFVTTSKDMRLLVGSRDHVVSLLQSLLSVEDSQDDYYFEEGPGRGGEEVFERVPASSDFETELRRVTRRAVGVGGAGLQYLGLYDFFDPSIIRGSEMSSETSGIVSNMTVTLMVDVRNVNASSLPMVFRCQAGNVRGPPTTEAEVTHYLWETVATPGFIPSEPTCLTDGGSARVERRCIPSLDRGAAWGAFCAAGVCHDYLPPCEPPPAVCPEGFVRNAAVIVERTVRCDESHVVLCVVRTALYFSSSAANGLWSRNSSLGERVSVALLVPALDRIISIAVSDSPPVLWASAADICAQSNFSLASVTSQVYRDAVGLLSRSLYGARRLKMAVNLLRRDGELRWADGSPLTYPALSPSLSMLRHHDRGVMNSRNGQYSLVSAEESAADVAVCERTSFPPADEPLVPDEIESENGEKIEVDDPMLIRNWFASILVTLKPARCCPRQRTEQPVRLTWPRTCTGDAAATSLELCVDGGGRPALRRCVGGPLTGVEWGPVELGGSASAVVSNTSGSLHKLAHTPVAASNVVHTAGELERLTSSPALLVAQDIASVATTLNNVRWELERRLPSTAAAALNLQRSAVIAVDQIMDADSAVLEAATSSLGAGPRSVRALERILVTSSAVNAPVVTGKNVAARAGAFRGVTSLSPHINVSTVRPVTDTDPLSVIFGKEAALVLVDSRLPADAVFVTFRDGRLLQSPGQRVTSQVVSVLIPSASAEEGPRRTVLAAFRSRPGASAPTPTCAFWDFHSAEWSTRGCWLEEVRNGSDVCTCNHLTNFARVFNYEPDIYLSEAHHRLLDVITYVGCALSLLGLVLTMLTFVLLKKWRRLRGNQIVMHLSVALTGVYVSFLGGLAAPGYHVACSCLSALLHYFLLAAVRVLGTYIPGFMRKASLFAWGGSLVPVICVLAVRHESYDGHADICWMDYDSFYYAFATPVLAVMVFNATVFGMVVHALSCGRQKGLRTNQSERRQALTRLRVAFVIFVLLGLPWVFGFLAIREARFVFASLFCVCNMLQGFAIFLLMVVGERSGRELWHTLLAGKCCAGEDETSTSTRAPTATTPSSSGPSKSAHVQQESRL